MNIKERAKKLKSDIPAVFIALKDKDTPLLAKIVAGITVGYALSPVDLIPDFIPFLGYLDDVFFLPALVALTAKLIPKEVWSRSKKTPRGCGKKANRKGGIMQYQLSLYGAFFCWSLLK
jgi:uncharacterized membrane protein YkvA (DUF1232 family)